MSKRDGKNGKRGGAWKLLLLLVIVVLLIAVAKRITKPAPPVETTPLPTVSVAEPERSSIKIETSLIGQIVPGDVYYVTPKVAGEIREIYVQQGDTVKEGDPIAKIDNQKQIDAAKIAVDSAQVQVNTYTDSVATAKTNLDRMQALLNTGDISNQAYEQTKSAYDQAASGLQAAQLQLQSARLQYDTQVEYATVTAPVAGKIESESMELNAMASQTTQLCVISGDSAKKLQFSVTDRLLPSFTAGEAVKVEKQGQTYEGTITNVSTMVGQTGLYSIEASVADGGAIPAGASVKVYFTSEHADDVLTVPTDAVYYDGGKDYVYTLEYIDKSEIDQDALSAGGGQATVLEGNQVGRVHKVEVTAGLSDEGRTEITSGIAEGDTVIVSWTNQLYEGAQVQVLSAANAAAAAAGEAGAESAAAGSEAAADGSAPDGNGAAEATETVAGAAASAEQNGGTVSETAAAAAE